MDDEVIFDPIDNGDGTFSKKWELHIKYVERDLLKPPSFYDTRIEFDLLYTVTYDAAKTWSRSNYVIDNIEGPKDDAIIWGDYEVIEKADRTKEVWRTSIGVDGLANFPASASYPIRNQQTAWAVLRQTEGADTERDRLFQYLRQEMADEEFPEGWRWDYMDFMWGWAWGETAYEDIPSHVPDLQTGRLPLETLSYYLNAHKTWYQTEFHDDVPVGPGSYPYRDRTQSAAASLGYRESVWFWSRAYRMKAVVDTLWRQGEAKLDDTFNMLSEAGWDGRGPAKSLLGLHGGIGASRGYKGYWLAAFAMACNVVWRYADFAGRTDIINAVEPLCHETIQRILDIRVPTSGIYSEMDEDGNIVERMHPDIVGWIFDAYDWDAVGNRYLSRAWVPHAASVIEQIGEGLGISKPFQPDWRNGANVSYESALMYWKALDMYVANFADATAQVNQPPYADAGSDQTVHIGATVTLDASGSSDPDAGDILSYEWEQPAGPVVQLSNTTAADPSFTAPTSASTLTFKVTVADNQGASDSDTVTIRVRDLTPAAPGNLDAAVGNEYVDLTWDDPSDSSITSYQHRPQESGGEWGDWTTIPQSGATTTSYRKTGLTNGTEHWFEIRAVNRHGPGTSAQVGPVTPTAPAGQPTNRRPSADAGSNQIVNRDEVVTLDGSASRDIGGGGALTYAWRQTQGPRVSLTETDTSRPTFTTPPSPTYLRFRLTVTDEHGASDIDAVVVRVADSPDSPAAYNRPPTANAGRDQTVGTGVTVTLDGSASRDRDSNDTLSYVWRQTVGPSVALSDTTVINPTFTAPSSPARLRFRLTVTDQYGAMDIDAVEVEVT